jgi:hypothetical protein
VGRSAAYWATNRYSDPRQVPKPSSPYKELPSAAAGRFRKVREGLLALEGVHEQVKYMGVSWRWAWEYHVGHRKLCWLHVMTNSLSATFTVSTQEESKLLALPKLSTAIAAAIRAGQRTGPVTWCWMELSDQKCVDAFLGFARRKLDWMMAETAGSPMARRSLAV